MCCELPVEFNLCLSLGPRVFAWSSPVVPRHAGTDESGNKACLILSTPIANVVGSDYPIGLLESLSALSYETRAGTAAEESA